MSRVVAEAAEMLAARLDGGGFDGSAKLVFDGEGALMLDANGVRIADEDADVTLTASPAVFKALFDGELAPAGAFMSGKLAVEGDMGLAMKLGALLG